MGRLQGLVGSGSGAWVPPAITAITSIMVIYIIVSIVVAIVIIIDNVIVIGIINIVRARYIQTAHSRFFLFVMPMQRLEKRVTELEETRLSLSLSLSPSLSPPLFLPLSFCLSLSVSLFLSLSFCLSLSLSLFLSLSLSLSLSFSLAGGTKCQSMLRCTAASYITPQQVAVCLVPGSGQVLARLSLTPSRSAEHV